MRAYVFDDLEDILKACSAFIMAPVIVLVGCMANNLMTGLSMGKNLGNYLRIQQQKKYRKPWPDKKHITYSTAQRRGNRVHGDDPAATGKMT